MTTSTENYWGEIPIFHVQCSVCVIFSIIFQNNTVLQLNVAHPHNNWVIAGANDHNGLIANNITVYIHIYEYHSIIYNNINHYIYCIYIIYHQLIIYMMIYPLKMVNFRDAPGPHFARGQRGETGGFWPGTVPNVGLRRRSARHLGKRCPAMAR